MKPGVAARSEAGIDSRPTTLAGVLDLCWALLTDGATRRHAPFHTPVLATVENGEPRARTVVLRGIDTGRRHLYCHTDVRSTKCAQLAANPRVSWLFYDAERKVQIRATGTALLHTVDELADKQWANTLPFSRLCYMTGDAPSIRLNSAEPPWFGATPQPLPTAEASEHGRRFFGVIDCHVDSLDWLHLDVSAHARARFAWHDNDQDACWLAP